MTVIVFFVGMIAGGAVSAWAILLVAIANLPKSPATPAPARPERMHE